MSVLKEKLHKMGLNAEQGKQSPSKTKKRTRRDIPRYNQRDENNVNPRLNT